MNISTYVRKMKKMIDYSSLLNNEQGCLIRLSIELNLRSTGV